MPDFTQATYKTRIMDEKNKWQPLELKLKKGVPLKEACEQAGVDVEDAKEYLNAKKELEKFQDTADNSFFFREAIETAINELKLIIKKCPDPEVRRRASKDLLEFYRDERRRLEGNLRKAKDGSGGGVSDLWDSFSPWNWPNK